MSNYVGSMGLLALLAFSMLTFLVLALNISFKLPVKENAASVEEPVAEEKGEAVKPKVKNEFIVNANKEPELTAEEAGLRNAECQWVEVTGTIVDWQPGGIGAAASNRSSPA